MGSFSDNTNTTTNSSSSDSESEYIRRHHVHRIEDYQCTSLLLKHIRAPLDVVWGLVRRFEEPQRYKPFVQRCRIVEANNNSNDNDEGKKISVGCIRHVSVISDLPATTSVEKLEILDEDGHILSYRILGGDHRLKNYSSIITLHPCGVGTLAVESYVVDIPEGNTREDTRFFVEALIKCNLKSLADIAERLASVQ